MDTFTAYEGHLAAEANGFHLNEEIVKDVFLESLENTARSEMLAPLMKSKDEITDADREWTRTHIIFVDPPDSVDTDYLDRLAKEYAEAKKNNPDLPYGGWR